MIKDLITNAPVEYYFIRGRHIAVRREDLAYARPLPANAKMSALYEIVKEKSYQYKLMAMFAKKQQGVSYALGFPHIAKEFNVETIITYPTNRPKDIPAWLAECKKKLNVEVITLHPNMVTININQTKKIVEDRGGYFIPFGFDSMTSVLTHRDRFVLPKTTGTLIMATMTGMTLAGAIAHLQRHDKVAKKIIGVSCGRPPENVFKSMRQYIDVPDNVEIINPFDRNFKPADFEEPFPLHPDYELKAWYWMLNNLDDLPDPIYFINVGANL